MKRNISYTYHQYPHPHEDERWESFSLHSILVIPDYSDLAPVNKTLNMLKKTPDHPDNFHSVGYHKKFKTWIVNGNFLLDQEVIDEAIEKSNGVATLHIYDADKAAFVASVGVSNIPVMQGIVNSLLS